MSIEYKDQYAQGREDAKRDLQTLQSNRRQDAASEQRRLANSESYVAPKTDESDKYADDAAWNAHLHSLHGKDLHNLKGN